jgi:hypothetical protein
MAITINDQPYQYTPVGQRLMLVASSTNVANAGFRFVFDFGMFTINVQPNAQNKGMLDLAPIFRESLFHEPSLITTILDAEYTSVVFISCAIREGWLVDGVFEISGSGEAVINDLYAFLAEYQVSDGYKPNPNTRYALDGITKYAMSERNVDTHKWIEAPSRGLSNDWVYVPTRVADYGVLYAPSATAKLSNYDFDFDIAVYSSYDDDDVLIDTQFLSLADNPSIVNVVGAFYANIDLWGGLDLTGAKYYTIQIGKEIAFPVYTPASRVYCFYIVPDDCRFDNVRLGWTNTVGGVDYFNFTKKSELSFNYDRKQYQKVVGTYNEESFGFNTHDRGTTERYVTTTKGLQINSDWVSVGEFNLLQTLCRSNDVFIINDDGTMTPVLVDTQNFVIKDERYSKLYNVTLNLKYSQPVGL